MKKSQLGERRCSATRALAAIGDTWSFLIVRELFLGSRRFEEFQAQTGASPTTISRRLAHLVEQGIVRRVPYQQHPPRDEFRLTRKGVDLWPVLVALTGFGDRWEQARAAVPLKLRHKACGHAMQPRFVCSACAETVTATECSPELSPQFSAERRQLAAAFKRTRGAAA